MMNLNEREIKNYLDRRIKYHWKEIKRHKFEENRNSDEFELMNADILDTFQEVRKKLFGSYKTKYYFQED